MDGDKPQPKPSAEGDLAHTNVSNIWQTMVKTVRDVDMQKVADTKEDLDTLLVFAGLFSAVVTTFVVDSYSSLQPDNSDEIVFLLRQSLAQNYTLNDGVLRPVNPFPTDPPFEVPLWALRVNGLWFASLIVSLSTASFGMLVKQWLIEYLAMEQWISPQEQLRARQYRRPGLEDWKVFEIAAMLPLLLHISLGLFFLGLCLYTAAANEIVGRSTFPLVAGWAFFALLTVFAPLASPRCPYKITLLKAALRVGRRSVAAYLRGPIALVARATWTWFISPPFYTIFFLVYGLVKLSMYSLKYIQVIAFMITRIFLMVFIAYGDFVEAAVDLPLYGLPFFLIFLPLIPLGYIVTLPALIPYARRTAELEHSDEEDETMRQPLKAHQLLLSVDELIINDGPILETMTEVLTQTHNPPASLGAFLVGCIRHRIPTAERDDKIRNPRGYITGLLDLRALSDSAWDLLAELAVDILGTNMPDQVYPLDMSIGSDNLSMANTAAVLLCRSGKSMPERAALFLDNPARLAKLLLLVGNLSPRWPFLDVLDVVWAVLMTSEAQYNANTSRSWGRVLNLLGGPALDVTQHAVISVLLANTWGPNGGDNGVERTDIDKESIAEGTMMLLSLLGMSSPAFSAENREITIRSSLHTMDSEERNITKVADALDLLPSEYTPVASLLISEVGTSHVLITGALNPYKTVLSGVIHSNIPFWKWINDNLQEINTPLFQASIPALRDLWSFVLGCAPASGGGGSSQLMSLDYIKVVLALLRPRLPHSLGRENPADDFERLASLLTRAADNANIYMESGSRPRGMTLSDLADHTRRRFPSQPNPADVPSTLMTALDLLAPNTSGNSDDRPERRGLMGTRIRQMRQSEPPDDARRLEEGLAQSEPPAVDVVQNTTPDTAGHDSTHPTNPASTVPPAPVLPTLADLTVDAPRDATCSRSSSRHSEVPRNDPGCAPQVESMSDRTTQHRDTMGASTGTEGSYAVSTHHHRSASPSPAASMTNSLNASTSVHTLRSQNSPVNRASLSAAHMTHPALRRSRSVPNTRTTVNDTDAARAPCRRRSTGQPGDPVDVGIDSLSSSFAEFVSSLTRQRTAGDA